MVNIVNMNVVRRVEVQILTRPGPTNKACRRNLQQEPATSQPLIHVIGVVLVEKLCYHAANEPAEASGDSGSTDRRRKRAARPV